MIAIERKIKIPPNKDPNLNCLWKNGEQFFNKNTWKIWIENKKEIDFSVHYIIQFFLSYVFLKLNLNSSWDKGRILFWTHVGSANGVLHANQGPYRTTNRRKSTKNTLTKICTVDRYCPRKNVNMQWTMMSYATAKMVSMCHSSLWILTIQSREVQLTIWNKSRFSAKMHKSVRGC